MDERYLVARVKSKGVVVLTGCSHAGVINVCQDVKRALEENGESKLFFVVGGFHLAGASVETRIQGEETFPVNVSWETWGRGSQMVVCLTLLLPSNCERHASDQSVIHGTRTLLGMESQVCLGTSHAWQSCISRSRKRVPDRQA